MPIRKIRLRNNGQFFKSNFKKCQLDNIFLSKLERLLRSTIVRVRVKAEARARFRARAFARYRVCLRVRISVRSVPLGLEYIVGLFLVIGQ